MSSQSSRFTASSISRNVNIDRRRPLATRFGRETRVTVEVVEHAAGAGRGWWGECGLDSGSLTGSLSDGRRRGGIKRFSLPRVRFPVGLVEADRIAGGRVHYVGFEMKLLAALVNEEAIVRRAASWIRVLFVGLFNPTRNASAD
jgi:hypothetical protein